MENFEFCLVLSFSFQPILLLNSKHSLPWDQTTAIGYIGEVCFQIMMGEGYLFSNGALLLLLISMCWHHQAFYKMFRHFVCEIDSKEKNAKLKLCELVRFHILVRR